MPGMPKLVFTDTETTGLYPQFGHEVWDIAAIARFADGTEEEHQWLVQPQHLELADPMALKIGRFYDRATRTWADPGEVAHQLARLLNGAHLVGNVTHFDAQMLQRFARQQGFCLTHHYHLVDVENLIAGKLGIPPPWDSTELSLKMGINPDDYERHTAIGDARWARDLYDRVFGID